MKKTILSAIAASAFLTAPCGAQSPAAPRDGIIMHNLFVFICSAPSTTGLSKPDAVAAVQKAVAACNATNSTQTFKNPMEVAECFLEGNVFARTLLNDPTGGSGHLVHIFVPKGLPDGLIANEVCQ